MWFLFGCGVWLVLLGLICLFNYAAGECSHYDAEPMVSRHAA